jgi:hypothetical protein
MRGRHDATATIVLLMPGVSKKCPSAKLPSTKRRGAKLLSGRVSKSFPFDAFKQLGQNLQ